MGSGSGPIGFRGRLDGRFSGDLATAARAERGLRRLLPDLAGARIERAWGGPIDVSADPLPFFGTVDRKRIHFGVGYSGNGAGPSWLGGQILASLALRHDDEWTALALATRRVPRCHPSRSSISAAASFARRSSRATAPKRKIGDPLSPQGRCRATPAAENADRDALGASPGNVRRPLARDHAARCRVLSRPHS
jgi:hypothetical protein